LIHVGRLAPVHQYDQAMLDDLFANRLYPTGIEFDMAEGYPGYPDTDGCILLVPGRYHDQHTDQISAAIARYKWVLAMRVGDEEDWFDISKVSHPSIKWWVQTPKVGKDYGDARFIGVGYAPYFRGLHAAPPPKALDVFMSAQNTHVRRNECFDALKGDLPGVALKFVNATEGFTQGLDPATYVQQMRYTKVAPAPSGAQCPDSFRVWEALESHAIPIADDVSPVYDSRGFWDMLLPGAPFPILTDYSDLPGYINDVLEDWPATANRVAAWWMRQKRQMARDLVSDLRALGAL
jgi:hypothetical protein